MSLGRRCLSRVPYSGLEASSRRGLVVTVFYGAVFLGLLAGNGGHGDMVSGLLEYHVVEEVGAAFLGQRVAASLPASAIFENGRAPHTC